MAFDKELLVALEAAGKAAKLIRKEYESFAAIPDAPVSITTHVDKASQDLILKHLHAAFPADALCAEESIPGYDNIPKSGRRTWVVDPIDGTRGFAKKTGQFSVMIGLLADGMPVLGVVAEPAQDRITYAQIGNGCYCAVGEETLTRCRVSKRAPGALVLTQSWAKPGQTSRPVEVLKPAKVIETYSGGVKLAQIARGEADVYPNTYEMFYDWDICAGHILVTEAGGKVTDLAGDSIVYRAEDFSQRKGLLATNGPAHDEVLKKLAAG
ncbi:MAG: 3'(2'),5'-bisphosphate nucleotidase CysQ [Planctomycetaceae bacterium]|nr:3'(2'),5'-bisphosphate nucleotidase CysQ [Planctomycetaceae bacterium]